MSRVRIGAGVVAVSAALVIAAVSAAQLQPTGYPPGLLSELSVIESIPSAAALSRYGAGIERTLQRLATDGSAPSLARNRAITLLRRFPSRDTQATLRRVIGRHGAAVRGPAVVDLQQGLASYALTAGPAALAIVVPYLGHRSIDVRVSAAGAVHSCDGQAQAHRHLSARLKVETSPTVRAELRRLLDRPLGDGPL